MDQKNCHNIYSMLVALVVRNGGELTFPFDDVRAIMGKDYELSFTKNAAGLAVLKAVEVPSAAQAGNNPHEK